MTRTQFTSSLFLLAIVVANPANGNEHQQSKTQSVTIVTLGDSITKGVRSGVKANETFAARLQAGLKLKGITANVVNVGIGGERTDQALKRLAKGVVSHGPRFVTVMYGTNDSYIDRGKKTSRITSDEYRSNLLAIVGALRKHGITTILMTEPRWAADAKPNGLGEHPNVRLEAYVKACREVAKRSRVPLVDHFAHWTAAEKKGQTLRSWTTDGCHPNPLGHREIANVMLPVVLRALEVSTKVTRIVCFGDSVTGLYYHTGGRRTYTDMLGIAMERANSDSKFQMINAGISGHTTRNALERIDRDVLAHRPSLVTVMFGLNDMVRVPLDEYAANLVTIIKKCRAIKADVVLCTPNSVISTSGRPTKKLIEYCDVVRRVAREQHVRLCDCYAAYEALRQRDPLAWRLLLSDEIHPNMDGHKLIATEIARTVTGKSVSLDDIGPPSPAIAKTLALLKEGKPVKILAMPPFDKLIGPVLKRLDGQSELNVISWPTAGLTLPQLEQDAKRRVRAMKPDLVIIAVPRTATAKTHEQFIRSYSWVMNWSLSFGRQQWDCIVVHPSVAKIKGGERGHDQLLRQLVKAQDLSLIDRHENDSPGAGEILAKWLRTQRADE